MKKFLFLGICLLFGVLMVTGLVAAISVYAKGVEMGGNIDVPPLITYETQVPEEGLNRVLPSVKYETLSSNKDLFGEGNTMAPNDIEDIDLQVGREGFPLIGEIVTFTYQITPTSSDGEDADAYMFYAPKGWEILEISPAPPASTGCVGVVDDLSNTGVRSVAYWGHSGMKPDLDDPPDDLVRSLCGPWSADGAHPLDFWVRLRVDPNAVSCPGMSKWVGIPWDTLEGFVAKPEREDSMVSFLFGDGSGESEWPKTTWYIQLQQACPLPTIEMNKTVGLPGDCPAGGTQSISVVPGTIVEYCYEWVNTSSLITVTYHNLEDSLLGNFDYTESLTAGFSVYLPIPFWITGTPGTTVTNVATWTAITTVGFGQSPQDVHTATFAYTQYYTFTVDDAIVNIITPTGGVELFLPLITKVYPPQYPKLLSPANNETVNLLIPDLLYDPGPTPPYPIQRIYLGTDRYDLDRILNLNGSWDRYEFDENLPVGTEHFWRVCFAESFESADKVCSPIWAFTTGTGGTFPSKPTLVSPENNAVNVPPDNTVVDWSPAANASEYEAVLHPVGSFSYYLVITTETEANFSWFVFENNALIDWYVRAKNDYAWGPQSDTWRYQTGAIR